MNNNDALDDLARQLAAATVSRRTTLKAMAVSLTAGLFLDRHHGPARPSSPQPASTGPQCDWSAAGADCGRSVVQTAACAASCAKVATTLDYAACAACVSGIADSLSKCESKLNCQCPAGTTSCGLDWFAECCESPSVCVNPWGCKPPCDGCSTRDWTGDCDSSCTSSEMCCNSSCLSSSSYQCCQSPEGEFICPASDVCCAGADPSCAPGGSLCCAAEDGTANACAPAGDYFCCGTGDAAVGCCPNGSNCIYNDDTGYYCCCPADGDYACASGVCVPAT